MRTLVITLVALIFVSCGASTDKSITGLKPQQAGSLPGLCPYFTKAADGEAVLSWVAVLDSNRYQLCFSKNINGEFSKTIDVPNTENISPHGENMPKVIFKPSGEIIAVWGIANPSHKNKYSGLIFYSQSFNGGKNWTPARKLVSDTSGVDQRYFDIAILPNGEAGIIWLDDRKNSPGKGSSLYFASTRGRNGFQNELRVSEPACPCCRTDLFVDNSGTIHALYRGIINDSIRDMVHTTSENDGKTFSKIKRIHADNWVIDGCPHTGPSMTENTKGLHFAWYTGGSAKGCFYTKSSTSGHSFDAASQVNPAGSHPQMTALPGGSLLITWDEAGVGKGSTFKKIGVQVRDKDGRTISSKYITDENSVCSYPVIFPVDKRSAWVAYTEKSGERDLVKYQVVRF